MFLLYLYFFSKIHLTAILKEEINKDKIGLTHIARELNVSVSTVSRALNNHPRISKRTKERVRRAATKLGYFPGIPELMTPDKTNAVAIVVPSIESCVNRKIIDGVTDEIEKEGYRAIIVNLNGDETQESAFFKTFRKYGISGIVHVNSNRLLPAGFYAAVQKDNIPLVTLFDTESDLNTCRVVPDLFKGVSRIVNHLKANNTFKITMLLKDENNPVDNNLVSTFEMVFDNLGLNLNDLTVIYSGEADRQIETLLQNTGQDMAFVVKDMTSTLEFYTFAQKKGMAIPDDLMLIGVGSDCSLQNLTSGISTLKIPAFKMGVEAAKLLFSQINGEETLNRTVVIPADFILKQSAIRI